MENEKTPVFTKLIIRKYVDKLYENVLMDERIRFYFDDIDMKIQKEKQTQFLYQLMARESDVHFRKDFVNKHQQLRGVKKLDEKAFHVLIENFQKTCSDLKMPKMISNKLIHKVSSLKNNIFF